ncbi:Crp/Fnr family transcriptional regulator [Calothrix sp. PCC 6303]|uniref:Crp/Fnr family transcriptional regulator n=1 Tax=Calothrix sp. PCC 6303 TaxID=1170562 RepID=UPI0002A016CA|nr:Crp/Fnr family transcriptional regulator [Calothrix sp. PCC 6303]AFY99160.1 putative transcriptional regulator, Crp/Fnr family [Calothrix sp. PCC 6303]
MFQPLETIIIFQKQAEPQVFAANQIIFEEGQPGDLMYGVLEGEVDISVNGKVAETIQSGDIFGSGVLVGIQNRTYTATAKTDCKLAFLDEKRFLFAVQETPTFALQVMRSYSQRLSRLEHQR